MADTPPKLKAIIFGIAMGAYFFGTFITGSMVALGPEDRMLEMALVVPGFIILALYVFIFIGLLNMKYTLDDKALILRWAFAKYSLPWEEITEVKRVTGRLNLVNYLGFSWPGYVAGAYDLKGVGVSKIFGTDLDKMLVVKHGPINYALTPSDAFADEIVKRTSLELTTLDTYDLPDNVIGRIINEDLLYLALFSLNLICLGFLGLYIAIFFPGSGADPITLLYIVLAIALLAFNMVNASRIFHYMPGASYLMWMIGLTINISFLAMSMKIIGFGL